MTLEQLVWAALPHGEIEPVTAIREIQNGLPGGVAAVLAFTRHPLPRGRLAASGARERRTPAPLSFALLGGFSVTRAARKVDDAAWERRIAQRVVRYLLLRSGGPACEDTILETFWPDTDPGRARRSLRVAVSRARRVLDAPGVPSIIETADRVYRLRLRPGDSVDADDFEKAARAALRERDVTLLERATALWGGEPLPEERYTDWALGWRERLMDLHTAVLAALVDGRLQRGDVIGAGLSARDMVEADPLNEGAHRRLMLAYARAGRRGQALHQYLECRRALVGQFGVEPSAETAHLHQRILAGERV